MTNVKCGFTMNALSPLIYSIKLCRIQVVLDLSKMFFNFSYSFSSKQFNLEDQNTFISLAKYGETRTPSTGTNNDRFISGLKFSSITVSGIRSKKLELLAYIDFHKPQIVAIQETNRNCPYSVYRKDRNYKGGGVTLLIYKDISHMPITELENDSESVWVKVFANKTSHFVEVGINLLVEI